MESPVLVVGRADPKERWTKRIRRWLTANIFDPARHPIPMERVRLNRERWQSLPSHLQVSQQAAGEVVNSCGGTHGVMDACNLSCTACYLADGAASARPLPEAEVKAQLDELRTMLGPQGKCQLTAGEVTLLPEETLGAYISHAIAIGLDPMLMTNGQRLLEDDAMLDRLATRYDLQKLAVHVDITQGGRRGWEHATSESDLMPLRDQFAELIRAARPQCGRPLHAAHTVTVSRDNLHDVPGIMAWMLDNADAFRMVSFQPVASVGRTTEAPCNDVDMDLMWEHICRGMGHELNRHAMYYGHPECTILACLAIVQSGQRRIVLEVAEEGQSWDQGYLGRLMRAFGGLSTTRAPLIHRMVAVASNCLRHPLLVLETPIYLAWRAWRARGELLPIIRGVMAFKGLTIHPLAVVVHRFMDAEQMETPLGRERLSCCVFKVSIDGEPVSMCEMNAGEKRAQWYAESRF